MNYFPEDDSVYEPAKNIIKYKRKKETRYAYYFTLHFLGFFIFETNYPSLV